MFSWIPRLTGKRVILTIHGLDWARDKWKGSFGSWYIRMGEKTGARCVHEIIVLNHSTQKYFLDTYGRTTHYIPNGVNPAAPVPADIIREKYGLEKDSYILYLGRMVPEKAVTIWWTPSKSLTLTKSWSSRAAPPTPTGTWTS